MFKTTVYLLFYFLLSALITIAACNRPIPSEELIDDAGSHVVSVTTAQRIVSLAPSNTEIAYALGLGDRLAGVTEYCNYPPEAKKKTLIGGFSTVDIEKTVALQPDLILAADMHSKSVTPALQKIGFNVVTLNPKTLQAVLKDIALVGKISGQYNQSQALVDNLNKRIDTINSKTRELKPDQRPRVLLLIWHDPLMAAGKGTLIDDLINISGGLNVASDINEFKAISLEVVIQRNPEVIIVPMSMGKGESPLWNYINTEPRLKTVNAVKYGRLYQIDGDIALRYGPRTVEGLEQFAGYIHPDLFPSMSK